MQKKGAIKSSKIFIDTNVFIRFLTKDVEDQYKDCAKLFEAVEEGRLRPYTSNIVLLEIYFILTTHYNFTKDEVSEAISIILQTRNLTLIEKTDTKKALMFFDMHKIKYADCLIATQIPKNVLLLTYDADFRKFPSLAVASPKEAIT